MIRAMLIRNPMTVAAIQRELKMSMSLADINTALEIMQFDGLVSSEKRDGRLYWLAT